MKHSSSVLTEKQGQALPPFQPHKASVVQGSPVFNKSCYTISSSVLIAAPAFKQKLGHLSKEKRLVLGSCSPPLPNILGPWPIGQHCHGLRGHSLGLARSKALNRSSSASRAVLLLSCTLLPHQPHSSF